MLFKALLLSVVLHSMIVVAAVMLPLSGGPSRHEDPITVYLAAEDEGTAVSEAASKTKKFHQRKKMVGNR